MAFKLSFPQMNNITLPKNKKDVIACCMCLILVILLSQSHASNYMIYSNLGRVLSILFVIITFSFNKTFGIASAVFLSLAFYMNYHWEGFDDQKGNNCKSYLLECEDCKKMGNGSYCEMHSTLCQENEVDGKESMCPMQKKKKAQEGMATLVDKERRMQLGIPTQGAPLIENTPSLFEKHVIGYDGQRERGHSFP